MFEVQLNWVRHIRKAKYFRPPFQASIRELVKQFPGMGGVQHIVQNLKGNIFIN